MREIKIGQGYFNRQGLFYVYFITSLENNDGLIGMNGYLLSDNDILLNSCTPYYAPKEFFNSLDFIGDILSELLFEHFKNQAISEIFYKSPK